VARVEASVVVAVSAGDAFDLTQDYALRLEWDPFLRSLEFLDGATATAPGVRVRVRARNGFTMEVDYVSVDRPSRVAMRMLKGPWFLKRFAGTWEFTALDESSTRITFVYGFESRPAWLRPLLDPIIKLVFARDVGDRLKGLARGLSDPALMRRLRAAAPLVP
jgi:ribosome-associated toxin RatA of RatAB toxin-antitoxin module